jgi:hypothetical protein
MPGLKIGNKLDDIWGQLLRGENINKLGETVMEKE